jgi:hypothetical protein
MEENDQIFSEEDYYYAAQRRKKKIIIVVCSIVFLIFLAFTLYCAIGVRTKPNTPDNADPFWIWNMGDIIEYLFP